MSEATCGLRLRTRLLDNIPNRTIIQSVPLHWEGRLAIVTIRGAGCGDAAASGAEVGGWAVLRTEGREPSTEALTTRLSRRPKSCGFSMPNGASRIGEFAPPTGLRNTSSDPGIDQSAGKSTKQAGSSSCAERRVKPVAPEGLRALVLPTTASRAGKGGHRAPGVPRALSREGRECSKLRRPRAANNRGDPACLLHEKAGVTPSRDIR
ncbi:MAG: hypothetical protein JWQ24_3213 [Tardiphaga sp.]|nr:hypothetical protein [Tardiphaga sp.]